MGSTQAAANALSNLAKAAVGLGFAGSALSMSMYNGTWRHLGKVPRILPRTPISRLTPPI